MPKSSNAPGALTRRDLLTGAVLGGMALAASGCTSVGSRTPMQEEFPPREPMPDYVAMYGPVEDGGYLLPAVPIERMDQQYLRQIVDDPTGERPGTIVVDTVGHFLYLVRENGKALRYGVGLGRAGFEWSGSAVVQYKREWPKWTPPDDMIARQPDLEKYSVRNGGMPGGPNNPLGARALYLFQNGEDTLYRIHGSPEWWSIGKSVSSGCVRLINQDIIDLYGRVPNRTPVIVTAGVGGQLVAATSFHKTIPMDAGVPGTELLGPAW